VRSVRPHIDVGGNFNGGVELFSPHERVLKPLQMDDKDLGEPPDGHLFVAGVLLLALGAPIPTLLHALIRRKGLQAVPKSHPLRGGEVGLGVLHIERVLGDGDTEVHVVVEGEGGVPAALALDLGHKLPLKDVSDHRVVPTLVVLPPPFALLIPRDLVIKVNCFVGRLLEDGVQLFVDSVYEAP